MKPKTERNANNFTKSISNMGREQCYKKNNTFVEMQPKEADFQEAEAEISVIFVMHIRHH